jgi:anti-sigma regulatory factor (Ser/Thr protein kinase)
MDLLRSDEELVYELTDRPGAVWLARQLLRTWLSTQRVAPVALDDLVLACSEICTEALGRTRARVVLSVVVDDSAVHLCVQSQRDGEVGDLSLARAVVDELTIGDEQGLRVVRCLRRRT